MPCTPSTIGHRPRQSRIPGVRFLFRERGKREHAMQCNATKAHSWTYVARSWRKFHKAKILRHYQSTQFHFTTIDLPLPEDRTRLGVTAEHGAIISAVVPGTPAAKASLKPGDVVMSCRWPEHRRSPATARGRAKGRPGQGNRAEGHQKKVKARLEEAPGDVFQPFGRRREPAPIVPEMRAPWPRSCARLEHQVERLQKRVQELERKLDKQPPH
jgi:hypothetical protein